MREVCSNSQRNWELIESSGANGGHKIYDGAGYRLIISQAEPQLFEI